MRAIGTLLAILLFLPASGSGKTITVRGEGIASCAVWLREHAAKTDRQAVQDSWILGYVNGVTGTLDIPGIDDISANVRNADLVAWVENYCESHPEEPIVRAADELMRELARRASNGPVPSERPLP
jgi:hypothetical protein